MWQHPRCANLSVAQQFLVVASVGTSAQIIRGRTIQASPFSFGNQFDISTIEFGALINPDVGADPYFGQSYYCVVYQRVYSSTDDDILCRLIDSNGATAVGPIYLSNSSGTQDIRPSISKSNGSGSWAISWQRNVNNSSTGIWAGRINWNGAISASPFQIINYPYAYNPSTSSPLIGSSRNMIAYEMIIGGSSADTNDIYADVIDGGTSIWSLDVSSSEFSSVEERQQVEPSVDSDGQHFSVMYSELTPGTLFDFNVYVTDVGMTGTNAFVTASRTPLATSADPEHGGSITSARSSNGPALRYLALWALELTTTADVYGALYDGREGGKSFGFCAGDGSSFSSPCPCGNNGSPGHGCANSANSLGASLYAQGSFSTVHDTTTLNVFGVPPTATCLFFQASSPVNPSTPFGDGLRCINGNVIRLGTENAVNGAAVHPGAGDPPLVSHGGIPLDGITAYYQCWYRNAAVFCTASTFNLSNAVIIEWGR
jgi:hypothetical protein